MGWGAATIPKTTGPVVSITPKTTNSTIRPSTTLGIDFETFYGTNFSLRKLTTTVYVRGLQMEEIHGASVSVNGEKPQWFRPKELGEYLSRFRWEKTAVLAHNAAFDGFILNEHFGITPAYFYDTMSMARALHSHDVGASLDEVAKYYGLGGKVAGALESIKGKRWHEFTDTERIDLELYCDNDVAIMWHIFNRMVEKYPHDELDLIDLSIKAFARPLLNINPDLVIEEQKREIREEQELINNVAKDSHMDRAQIVKALGSNPQFAQLLRDHGVEPPMKTSARTGKETFAFAKNDIAFQEVGVHHDERVRNLVKARLSVKSTIGLSRAGRVLEHGENGAKPIPIMLNYCKAHTMRWTGGDKINPQNFPSSRTASKLRYCLVAPKGYAVVVIDSSQIEDRMNAYVAGQMDVLNAYRDGQDNYKLMASRIYDVPFEEVTKSQRFVGKVARLGLGYQCGAPKFTYMLRSGAMGPPVYEEDLSNEEIRMAHAKYRAASPFVVQNWYKMQRVITQMQLGDSEILTAGADGSELASVGKDHLLMPNGLKLHYPKIDVDPETGETKYQSGKGKRSKIYGGLLTENYIQCLARIVVGEQMLKIAKEYPVVMMTHDEVVYLAPIAEAEDAYNFGYECMTWVPDWCPGLPVNADGGWGPTYGDVK